MCDLVVLHLTSNFQWSKWPQSVGQLLSLLGWRRAFGWVRCLFLQLSLRKNGPSWWVSRNCDQIWKSDMSRVWVQKRESRGFKKTANVWVESWTFGPKSQLSSGFIPHFSSPTTPFCSNKFIFDASFTLNHQTILFSKRAILYCYPVIRRMETWKNVAHQSSWEENDSSSVLRASEV